MVGPSRHGACPSIIGRIGRKGGGVVPVSVIQGTWRKSSYSNSKGGSCVEVTATAARGAAVRDTQHREHGHLAFSAVEWTAFIGTVKGADL
ncbi:DUF397 domain-containing protein [Streptomonospora nanhaiensis]|uniref:DUF397 domain-containing protein n=1 Tax=Streptomonospora nanhaiensis TaxID=1323731 RepID=UPI0015CB333A